MNDNDIINDYNPKLDSTDPNLKYIDKFPDWAQVANDDTNPNLKYIDKYTDWVQAADDDTKMRAAHDSMTEIVPNDEYFQRKIAEAMSPSAAEIKPEEIADLDDSIYRRR